MYNKAKGINERTGKEFKVMINARALEADQMKIVNDIIDFYHSFKVGAKVTLDSNEKEITESMVERWKTKLFTRQELRSAHTALRSKAAAPYFISKNFAAKRKHDHLYDLNVFKLRAGSEETPAEPVAAEKPAAKKKAAKKTAPKKEAKAKKEASKPKKGKKTEETVTEAAETAAS